jgi:hypothetical protein
MARESAAPPWSLSNREARLSGQGKGSQLASTLRAKFIPMLRLYWPKRTPHQCLTEPGTRQPADDANFGSSSVFGGPWGH